MEEAMSKRLRVATAFLLCLIVIGILIPTYVAILSRRPQAMPVTRTQFALINAGMTQAELESVLGPPRNECKNPVTVWARKNDGKVVSAEISPTTPKVRFFPDSGTDQPQEVVWISESGLIAVALDRNGRLSEKYFSTVHNPGRPSVMDWIRSRQTEVPRP